MESQSGRDGHGNVGGRAEDAALRWLSARGFKLLARNFRCRHGEIDLIMLDGEVLAMIEVRCRRGKALAPAAHTVDTRKQDRLVRTALFFLARHPKFASRSIRFDVLGFDRSPGRTGPDLWLRNAFQPDSSHFGR